MRKHHGAKKGEYRNPDFKDPEKVKEISQKAHAASAVIYKQRNERRAMFSETTMQLSKPELLSPDEQRTLLAIQYQYLLNELNQNAQTLRKTNKREFRETVKAMGELVDKSARLLGHLNQYSNHVQKDVTPAQHTTIPAIVEVTLESDIKPQPTMFETLKETVNEEISEISFELVEETNE